MDGPALSAKSSDLVWHELNISQNVEIMEEFVQQQLRYYLKTSNYDKIFKKDKTVCLKKNT